MKTKFLINTLNFLTIIISFTFVFLFFGSILYYIYKAHNSRTDYYERNCKNPENKALFFNCYEKQMFDEKNGEALKHILVFAKSGDPDFEYLIYRIYMNNLQEKIVFDDPLLNISKEFALKNLQQCTQKLNMECITTTLTLNYQTMNPEINKLYIQYFSLMKSKYDYYNINNPRIFNNTFFSYEKYLSINKIPQNETVYCVVFQKCDK